MKSGIRRLISYSGVGTFFNFVPTSICLHESVTLTKYFYDTVLPRTHGTLQIFHSWLSSCDKITIPHSRLCRSWGIVISSRLLSHSWKIGNVPSVMREEFYPSLFFSRPELTFPYKKENFNI